MYSHDKMFSIVDWYDIEHKMTAKELCDRVTEDSKSDYGWIASAEELVRVTDRRSFPAEYAYEIRLAILNCYANFEARKSRRVDIRLLRDLEKRAINVCYNYLSGSDARSTSVRHNYLKGVISAVSECHFSFLDFDHFGPTYFKMCEEWKKKKFEELKHLTYVDISDLKKSLHDDFDRVMKKAEADGAFKEDDEKQRKERKKLFSAILKL